MSKIKMFLDVLNATKAALGDFYSFFKKSFFVLNNYLLKYNIYESVSRIVLSFLEMS